MLCMRLAVTGAIALCVVTVLVAIGCAAWFEGLAWSPARIVFIVEIGLLAALVVYVRASRDAVERSNERVAGILDGSGTGFVRMDAQLRILDANGPWLRMVRATRPGEILRTRLPEWFPVDRRRAAEAMLAFLDEGDRRSFETELKPLRGPAFHVVVTAYAERVGDAVRISAVFADVSAIRRAEAEARASEERSARISNGRRWRPSCSTMPIAYASGTRRRSGSSVVPARRPSASTPGPWCRRSSAPRASPPSVTRR
jgi:PAS domain-containing protein